MEYLGVKVNILKPGFDGSPGYIWHESLEAHVLGG